MNNLTENNHGTGAIPTNPIKRMPTLGTSTIPFDWQTGFDVGPLVTKNQGASGSCGGQALSYNGEIESGNPKSARFPYCQVFAPGGGSSEQDLIKIAVTEGLADELVFSSYPNPGITPDEVFMENSSDITPTVLQNANGLEGTPVYISVNFEAIAQAVRDNRGIIIGIYGSNNGSWLSADPLPPTQISGDWAHWLCVVKAGMRNGRKVIGVKNSWGAIGENGTGIQYLTEDYLPYIFSAWTINKGKYVFNNNMFFGLSNQDVFALQAKLWIVPTGYFGPKTLAAVMAYQKTNGITATGFVGPLTRASLNK